MPHEIGVISVKSDHQIEWNINDIFSYGKEDIQYISPFFSLSGLEWYFGIYPNGQTKKDCVGWISLYLFRRYSSETTNAANFYFGVKKADGTVEKITNDGCWLFAKDGNGFGECKSLQKSELLRRKSDLAPTGDLTVTCSLWVKSKNFHSSERMDALSQNLNDLFLSNTCCDVTLKVKLEEFSVHKCIMSARSPVFAAMLETDMKEKKTGIVDIPDCDPRAFKDFLLYLYSGKIEDISCIAFQLYEIADKYDVRELKWDCLISIMDNLSLDNMYDTVLFGHQFDLGEVKCKTRKFFSENFQKIVPTEKWGTFMKENTVAAHELLKNYCTAK